MGEYRSAAHYDEVYRTSPGYAVHFTESPYYPAWMLAARAVGRSGGRRVIDLGCGPGQFAALLAHYQPGLAYVGVEFSAAALAKARRAAPGARFIHADLATTWPTPIGEHDVVVALEFLEHIPFDLELLSRLPAGVRVIASVPNFDWESHVRHFATAAAVRARYEDLLEGLRIQPVLLSRSGTTLYLFEGVRRDRGPLNTTLAGVERLGYAEGGTRGSVMHKRVAKLISVEIVGVGADGCAVLALGQTNSTGWTQAALVAWDTPEAPADGVLNLDFVAVPPRGLSLIHPQQIAAEAFFDRPVNAFWGPRRPLRGARVHVQAGAALAAAGEEMREVDVRRAPDGLASVDGEPGRDAMQAAAAE